MTPFKTNGYALDACVWINLLATGKQWDVIGALAAPAIAADEVIREVKRDPITRMVYPQDADHPLRSSPLVTVASLDAIEQELFIDLVGGSALDAIGDGEAAAIAVAVTRGLTLVTDDRKARRVASHRFSGLEIMWTVDLLRDRRVTTALGSEVAHRCVQDGVKIGRMHLPQAFAALLRQEA